jgi:guanylate kinase
VFIMPPSWEELVRRIRARGSDSEEAIATRLENARWEVSQADKYSHRIVNDDLSRAAAELDGLL